MSRIVTPASAIAVPADEGRLPTVWRPQCGTDAGWHQHYRRGEAFDPACVRAHADADRDRHRRRSRTWLVREWCWSVGRQVGGAGPIPREHLDAYLAAHPVRPVCSAPLPIVREWALQQGYPVSGRGLLPDQVIDAYNTAHPGGDA